MKRLLSIAVVSLLFCVDTFAQNPTRKVLYTFGTNERIARDEHFVQFHTSGYKFALVLEDTITQRNILVFNGQRIPYGLFTKGGTQYVPAEPNGNDNNRLGYIDVTSRDGYLFHFSIKGSDDNKYEYWVNRGGKMEGPYEYVWFDEDEPKSKTYHYVLADRVYDNVEGKVNPSKGIFEMPYYYASVVHNETHENHNTYISVNGAIKRFPGYGKVYINGDNYVVKTTKYGLYFKGEKVCDAEHISNVVLNVKGDYAYLLESDALPFSSSHRCYVVKNGVQLNKEGYKHVSSLYLTENGDLAYCYDFNKIHLPGITEDTAYKHTGRFIYRDGGRYAFEYSDDNNCYVKTDKTEFGPYNRTEYLVYDGEHYAFSYNKGDNWYVKTDKTEFGPYYHYITDIKIAENGDCYYTVKSQRYRNGEKLVESEDKSLDVDGHNFYSNYSYDYVIIDGQRFGKAAPFEYRYDKEKNAFVWYSIEGRELAVYEYALN